MPDDLDLATVAADRFEPLLHEIFFTLPWEGPADGPPVDLELIRITPSPLHAREGMRVPFSLIFRGPVGVKLGQGLYRVTHSQTGEMPLFLVPVGSKEDRLQMQAVMN